MTAKSYLFRLRTLKDNIRKCEEGIISIRHQMTGLKAIRYNTVKVQVSAESNLESLMDKLLEVERELKEYTSNYWLAVITTQAEIYCLDRELHRRILSEYFINGKTLKRIAVENHYDQQYIYNQYSAALKEFDKKVLKNKEVKKS